MEGILGQIEGEERCWRRRRGALVSADGCRSQCYCEHGLGVCVCAGLCNVSALLMCFCRDGQQTELSCNIFCVSPVEIYMLGFHLLLRDLSLCCFIREDFYSSQLFK